MKIALLMMATPNDRACLDLHLPVFKDAFDGFLALTDADNTKFMSEMYLRGAITFGVHFRNDWSEAFNFGLKRAEEMGFDVVVRIDPDELIWPEIVPSLKEKFKLGAKLVHLPRYNFFPDRKHHRFNIYPDPQSRAVRLGCGLKLFGKRHETVDGSQLQTGTENIISTDWQDHIFHYSWVGDRILKQQLRYYNDARIDGGLEPVSELPPDSKFPDWPVVPFEGRQPLDPDVIGINAPWG